MGWPMVTSWHTAMASIFWIFSSPPLTVRIGVAFARSVSALHAVVADGAGDRVATKNPFHPIPTSAGHVASKLVRTQCTESGAGSVRQQTPCPQIELLSSSTDAVNVAWTMGPACIMIHILGEALVHA
ncbi:hypothetical protein BV25DRAFT_173035 [Artomyces pyxidatus]|uniref:Uncharacterized protein n=1 Tax=Artomyces pyxidatus TaxID=48021 RepID=A0ACB8SHB8_9AGAM|nr:hypothetical protein BV25DRAFT_173035 [Artomyces pyxidatus]